MKQSTILATVVAALPILVFAFYSRELLGLFGKDFEAAGFYKTIIQNYTFAQSIGVGFNKLFRQFPLIGLN